MFNAKVKPRHFKKVFAERQATENNSDVDKKTDTVMAHVETV